MGVSNPGYVVYTIYGGVGMGGGRGGGMGVGGGRGGGVRVGGGREGGR